MRAILLAVFVALCGPVAAEQANWPIADINRAIDSTNFVVGQGCSGTLISQKDRLILTNYHCIDGFVTSVEQEVTGRDGVVRKVKIRRYNDVSVAQHNQSGHIRVGTSSFVAEIVAEDKNRDLALLRIRADIYHSYASPLLPDGGTVVRGETVYVVGNPLGQDATLGVGVVSMLRRLTFPWANGAEVDVVQHSAGSVGGNSGGALYNTRGQLIGVPAAGFSSAPHLGLAVSIDFVKAFLKQSCWERAYNGVTGEASDAQCELARKKRDAVNRDK